MTDSLCRKRKLADSLKPCVPELQVRRGNRDNVGILVLTFHKNLVEKVMFRGL